MDGRNASEYAISSKSVSYCFWEGDIHDLCNLKIESATFEFDLIEVKDRLSHYISEHNIAEATHILNLISTSPNQPIEIPEEYDYFGYIILDLIGEGKGTVNCNICNQTYKS